MSTYRNADLTTQLYYIILSGRLGEKMVLDVLVVIIILQDFLIWYINTISLVYEYDA